MSTPSAEVVVFQEKGQWLSGQIPNIVFTNVLRWTLDQKAGLIGLEHLRYGMSQPVFLFHLASSKPLSLESVDAHLCGDDAYLGHVTWSSEAIHFEWRISGPSKNDVLVYRYELKSYGKSATGRALFLTDLFYPGEE